MVKHFCATASTPPVSRSVRNALSAEVACESPGTAPTIGPVGGAGVVVVGIGAAFWDVVVGGSGVSVGMPCWPSPAHAVSAATVPSSPTPAIAILRSELMFS